MLLRLPLSWLWCDFSEHEDAVIQFQNTSGAFKSKFTDKKVNYANGLVMGWHTETSYLYVTGPYAGKVIVKFDMNNGNSQADTAASENARSAGTYIEHFEDRDLQYPLGMVYHEQTLYINDKNTIRTYGKISEFCLKPFADSCLQMLRLVSSLKCGHHTME